MFMSNTPGVKLLEPGTLEIKVGTCNKGWSTSILVTDNITNIVGHKCGHWS